MLLTILARDADRSVIAVSGTEEFDRMLHLQDDGDGRFTATPSDDGRGYLAAGELAAYLSFAASSMWPDREIRSAHSVFLRQTFTSQPLTIEVSPLHVGGQLAAANVSIRQEDRQCASGHVVFGPRGADLVRHQSTAPSVAGPEKFASRTGRGDRYLDVRLVGDGDPYDPTYAGPASWTLWVQAPGLADRPGISEALISFAANSFLVSAAVLPHKGLTMDSAHNDLMAIIITSDVVFHAPVSAGSWLLLQQESTNAGGGWVFGRGEAFDEDGTLLASFSEEAMLRKPTRSRPTGM